MAKEAYYFSHDANARQDEKILMLRAEHGWEGYGIYWALIEMMFESSDSNLHHSKTKGIAVSYNIDITVLESVINTCVTERLFVSDGVKFWSESLKRRKSKYHEMKAKKSEAGKKGMAKRWNNKQIDNSVITNDNTTYSSVITEDNKGKESKGKESKTTTTVGVVNPFDFYQQNFGVINPYMSQSIGSWIDDVGNELVVEAMKLALKQQKKWNYAEGILKRWVNENITSVDQLQYEKQESHEEVSVIPNRDEKLKRRVIDLQKLRQNFLSQNDMDGVKEIEEQLKGLEQYVAL